MLVTFYVLSQFQSFIAHFVAFLLGFYDYYMVTVEFLIFNDIKVYFDWGYENLIFYLIYVILMILYKSYIALYKNINNKFEFYAKNWPINIIHTLIKHVVL